MFNFNELKIIKEKTSEGRNYGSFVGIRKDNYTQEMIFNLPRGFDDFDTSYKNIKNLFFNMYKTFKKFAESRKNPSEIMDSRPQSKDNLSTEKNNSYRFNDSEDNEVILYSKIEMIDSIMSVHNMLDIDSLIQELGLIDDIDYSNIDNLVNNGIFLKNNSIVIDFMVGKRNVIHGIPAEVIEIYCYIYSELLSELEYEIDERVRDIAYDFSYKNLTSEQSLFNEKTYDSTIKILKDRLDLVHRHTSYKDHSYWIIYEAVEKFLYGGLVFDEDNGQGFWGISNFYQIWEDMCNSFFVKEFSEAKILYCDSGLRLENNLDNLLRKRYGGYYILIDKEFTNNFNIRLNNHERWMRPDLVVDNNDTESVIGFLVKKGVFSYEIEKTNNLISNSIIKIKLNLKKIDNNTISYDSQEKIFNYIINKFDVMTSRNHKRKLSKRYLSLNIKKVNSRLFHLNGISESDFLSEWDNIIEEDRKRHSSHDIHCIDWKYLPLSYFEKESKELKVNISKQLTYEFCLENNPACKNKTIKSQFGIPYYISTNETLQVHSNLEGIEICKLNFNKIQSVYLNG